MNDLLTMLFCETRIHVLDRKLEREFEELLEESAAGQAGCRRGATVRKHLYRGEMVYGLRSASV